MTRSSQYADRIIIGKIGAPFGVRGEMRIVSLTDFPERFFDMNELTIEDKVFQIEKAREDHKSILMKFSGVNSPEDAALLRGKVITVSREELSPLAEGEYYTFDIIGLRVHSTSGESLGEVKNVLQTGSNDVYEVKDEAGKEILVPALKKVVKLIDIENKKMVIDLSEMEMLDAK